MKQVKYDTINHNFKENEYVDLSTHQFDGITIGKCDLTGKLLQNKNYILDTRLQLELREST